MQSPPKKIATFSLVTENAEATAMDSDCVSESDIETTIVGVKPSSLLDTDYSSPDGLPSLEIRYVFSEIHWEGKICVLIVHRNKSSSLRISVEY